VVIESAQDGIIEMSLKKTTMIFRAHGENIITTITTIIDPAIVRGRETAAIEGGNQFLRVESDLELY
jgi:hypothetical protein